MTGKDCPRMWTRFVTGGEAAWEKFKQDVTDKIIEIKVVETMKRIFADIPAGAWYEAEVNKAFERGIVAGMQQSDGTRILGVGQPVTTERLMVFLNRAVDFAIAEAKKK